MLDYRVGTSVINYWPNNVAIRRVDTGMASVCFFLGLSLSQQKACSRSAAYSAVEGMARRRMSSTLAENNPSRKLVELTSSTKCKNIAPEALKPLSPDLLPRDAEATLSEANGHSNMYHRLNLGPSQA